MIFHYLCVVDPFQQEATQGFCLFCMLKKARSALRVTINFKFRTSKDKKGSEG